MAVLVAMPMFAAWEAHVVNVTATIENALTVPIETEGLQFGTVFPQEKLDKTFDISLSNSFSQQSRVNEVIYTIRQKPKCVRNDNVTADLPQFGRVTESATTTGNFICEDAANYHMLPLLCPFLSKHELSTDGNNNENDNPLNQGQNGIGAFHGLPGPWTLQTTLSTAVFGQLDKSVGDNSDTWNIDLKVPCFKGMCAQDWPDFVRRESQNQNINVDAYKLDPGDEHKLFGCDLWVEVTDVDGANRPAVGANLSLYQAPGTCNVTVNAADDQNPNTPNTIQGGVNQATDGQTVCVADGTYNETVTINKPLILASLTGASNTAIITGGVNIQADNVTVKGFKVNAGSLNDSVTGGFYLKDPSDNTLQNVTISDNDIDGTGSTGGRGIINAEGGTFSNILFENNKIHSWTTAIYMSTVTDTGNTDGVYAFTIKHNDIEVADNVGNPLNTAGIGQLNEALITLNEFTAVNTGAEAVGAGTDYDGSVLLNNNFLNGVKVNTYNPYPTITSIGQDVKAENNFWNMGGASQIGGSVDFLPQEFSAFPHR